MTGMRLWIAGVAQFCTPTPHGLLRDGLGSATSPILREIVGRKFSSTVSESLICGVTLITNPTGTEFRVVVNVVTSGALVLDTVLAWIVKKTRLSTTFSRAGWLL